MGDPSDLMVDIILPVHGAAPWITETIGSLYEQTHFGWHLYLVQDGPEGAETVRRVERIRPSRGNATVIRLPERRGAPAARMAGVEAGSGEAVAFVDQDDKWHPEKLMVQVRSLTSSANTALVYSKVGLIDGAGRPIVQRSGNGDPTGSSEASGDSVDPQDAARSMLVRNPVRLSTVLVRRNAFMAVGGFNTSLFGGEEAEFLVRFLAEGFTMRCMDQRLVFRRVHGENTSVRFAASRLQSLWEVQGRLVDEYPFLACALPAARRTVLRALLRRPSAESSVAVRRLASEWRSEGGPTVEALAYGLWARTFGGRYSPEVLQVMLDHAGRNLRRVSRRGAQGEG